MNIQSPKTLPLSSPFHCGTERSCTDCGVKLCRDTLVVQAAVKLIEAGARATLVRQVTQLPTKMVKRLFLMLTGHASPRGQMPFTDTWYRENERRMLHATIVWQLYRHMNARENMHFSHVLLDVYHAYLCLVSTPLLDITRTFFVLRLVSMKLFAERVCPECKKPFLAPADEQEGKHCSGCRLYFRFRCPQCKAPFNAKTVGRPRTVCDQCRQLSLPQK